MAKPPARDLRGTVAAITGGARGIGRATAAAMLARGMKVAIGDRDVATAEATAQELSSQGEIRAYPLDVTERASHAEFIDAAEKDLGPIDVYVNNAGIMPLGSFLDESDDSTLRQIDINVNGVLYGMKEIIPRFQHRYTGHLVNVASSAGKGGFPGAATYCGTKHFVVGVSEAVRAELKGSPIQVSCVMPAVVATELTAGVKETRTSKPVTPEEVAAEIISALQVPRFDVYVPRALGPTFAVMAALPRRGRDAVNKALGTDKTLTDIDLTARAGYELRAGHSADKALGEKTSAS